jgi:hypothetical protein
MIARRYLLVAPAVAAGLMTSSAFAQNIPFSPNVSVRVGQSVVLKGVRSECGQPAMAFKQLNRIPKSSLGRLSDGGVGTTQSRACGGSTPARAIRFTAQKAGSEQLTIYDDVINITVTP